MAAAFSAWSDQMAGASYLRFLRDGADQGLVPTYDAATARFVLSNGQPLAARDLTICVNTDTGDDAATGSATDPVRTIGRAYELMGPICRDVLICITGSARADMPRWGVPRAFRRLIFWGTDSTFTTDGKFVALSDVFAAGSTVSTLKVPGLTADEFRGYQLQILTGNSAEVRRTIAYHTSDDLSPTTNLPSATTTQPGRPTGGAPAAGDSFEIFRPSTSIDISAPLAETNFDGFHRTTSYDLICGSMLGYGLGGHDYQRPCVMFVNLAFHHTYTDHCFPFITECNAFFYGVEYNVDVARASSLSFQNAVVGFGADHADGENAQLPQLPPFDVPAAVGSSPWWAGYGLTFNGSQGLNTGIALGGSSLMCGMLVATGSASGFTVPVHGTLNGGSIYEGTVTGHPGSNFTVRSFNVPIRIRNTLSATRQAVRLQSGGYGSLADNVELEGVGPCVLASRGAFLNISSSVTGSSSGGTTVRSKIGAHIRLSGAPQLGDAAASDWAVEGGTPAVNKSFFAADGATLVGSGTIERADSTT